MEILVDLIKIVEILISHIIGPSDIVCHRGVGIVRFVLCCRVISYPHSSAKEQYPVQPDVVL